MIPIIFQNSKTMENPDKSKPVGRKLGLSLIFVGIIFGLINHLLLFYANVTALVITAYPMFIFTGLAMLIFPGKYTGNLNGFEEIGEFIKQTPKLHATFWIIGLVLGMMGLISQIIYYGLN
jgi:ribose/xylose/arabinose/galactoside ABC-type transport system permease subunit